MHSGSNDNALGARLIELFCHLVSGGGGLGRGHRVHSLTRKGQGVHTRGWLDQGLRAMSPGQGKVQPGEEGARHALDANQGPQAATSWGGGSVEGVGGAGEGGGGGGQGGVVGEEDV